MKLREVNLKQLFKGLFNKFGRIHTLNRIGGWQSSKKKFINASGNYYLTKGALVLFNPQMVKNPYCKGASDLVGYTILQISEKHIGRKIAVYTAIEIKSSDKIKKSNAKAKQRYQEQKDFIERVKNHGGIGVVAMQDFSLVEREIKEFWNE